MPHTSSLKIINVLLEDPQFIRRLKAEKREGQAEFPPYVSGLRYLQYLSLLPGQRTLIPGLYGQGISQVLQRLQIGIIYNPCPLRVSKHLPEPFKQYRIN